MFEVKASVWFSGESEFASRELRLRVLVIGPVGIPTPVFMAIPSPTPDWGGKTVVQLKAVPRCSHNRAFSCLSSSSSSSFPTIPLCSCLVAHW